MASAVQADDPDGGVTLSLLRLGRFMRLGPGLRVAGLRLTLAAAKRVAERPYEIARGKDAQANEVRKRIDRTQPRLGNLVELMADGDRSASVRDAVRDLEAQLEGDRSALKAAESAAREPLRLPSVEEGMLEQYRVIHLPVVGSFSSFLIAASWALLILATALKGL